MTPGESGETLTAIVNSLPDPIVIINAEHDIVVQNKRAEHLLSTGDKDSEGRRRAVEINNLLFTSHLSKAALGANEGAGSHELNLVDPDEGTDLLFEVLTHDLSGVEGTLAGSTVSVLRDVTDLRRAANELEDRNKAATADLAEQNTRLQWQSRELEKANRLKSEFLASMSHELRTPINALIGYASLMLDRIYGELTPRQEEGLSRIQGAAQHLLALINDILDLAKIEAGRMPLHLDDVTLGDIVTGISQQIEPLVRKKSLTYNVEMPSKDLVLHTDRTKVKQILLNLLSNAVKFTHQGGIWVTISKDEEDLRFDVRDTGIGIRATDLESIWEDFRQVDQSRTREFGGTGLGLSITRKLVDALGGHVFAESVFGQGSTFTVVLPIRSIVRPDDPPRVIDEVPPPPRAER
jgi:signal transduction histidine kinase